jgi:flagellar motility protein MotE (MotC chaperone)
MIRVFVLGLFLLSVSFAETQLIDCDKVFEERKGEILKEMQKLDQLQSEFEAFQEASNSLLDQKKEKVIAKIKELNSTLEEVKKNKEDIVSIFDKNKKLLEEIKNIKDNKISSTYLKMKDKKAATILNNMSKKDVAEILFKLTPKKISTIMSRMDPAIASGVTLLIKKGPPFDENLTE